MCATVESLQVGHHQTEKCPLLRSIVGDGAVPTHNRHQGDKERLIFRSKWADVLPSPAHTVVPYVQTIHDEGDPAGYTLG